MPTPLPTERPVRPPSVADAVLVLLGAQMVSILWVGLVVTTAYGTGLPERIPTPVQVLLLVGLWVGYGLGPVLLVRTRGLPVVPTLGLAVRPLDVPVGAVLGVLAQLAVLPALYWILLRFVDGDPGQSARELVDGVDGPLDAVLLTLAVVVAAPLVEEVFFRGLLLGALRRFGDPAALVLSALVFAAVHRQLLPLPGLFVFGLVAGALVLRTGRLGPAWFLHAAFNATTLLVLQLA